MAARYTRPSAGRTLVAVQAEAVIAGAAESPYARHPAAEVTTESLLADAFFRVLSYAGVDRDAIDGLGVSSFTLAPDHAIEIAWKLGLRPRWIMDDANGGASGLNLLQHALRAVEAGDASTIVLVAGDHLPRDSFHSLVDRFNRVAAELLAPLPVDGPNALFALLTQRHMAANGLDRSHYGLLAVAQRRFAAANPLPSTASRSRSRTTSPLRSWLIRSDSTTACRSSRVRMRSSLPDEIGRRRESGYGRCERSTTLTDRTETA
jgi:hypothetical protein